MLALIFPGQGSQAVGMGAALAAQFPAARAVLAEIDDALSQDLSGAHARRPRRRAQPHGECPAGPHGREPCGLPRPGDRGRASTSPATCGSWPAIPSANIRRLRPQAPCRSPTPRGCCGSGATRCSGRCRLASGPWRRCSVSTSILPGRSPGRRHPATRSATWPTTTARVRSSCPATRRPWNGRSGSPRGAARGGPSC